MRRNLFVLISVLAAIGSACDQTANQSIAFPKRAYLGETVSVAVDTDSWFVGAKSFTLSRENLRIQLWDQQTDATRILVPRAVILGSSAPATAASEQKGATEVSIAIFDLPTSLPEGFTPPPSTVWIYPLHFPSLEPVNTFLFPTLEILGPAAEGDGATVFAPSPTPPDYLVPIEARLEPLPALRLRVKQASSFPSAWTIGSVQFDVDYTTAPVSNPRAYAKNTVTRAFAQAKVIAPGRALVMLVDPLGLRLRDSVGNGPFVDVVFDQSAPFAVADFKIENLLVTDLDGSVLIDRTQALPDDSESYFDLYARANQ